jgi:uncharacterized membrane protein YkvI
MVAIGKAVPRKRKIRVTSLLSRRIVFKGWKLMDFTEVMGWGFFVLAAIGTLGNSFIGNADTLINIDYALLGIMGLLLVIIAILERRFSNDDRNDTRTDSTGDSLKPPADF